MKSLTPLILIILAIGSFFIFIDPKFGDIKELQEEIDDNQELIDIAVELRRKREELQDKFNMISPEEREKLEKVLPDAVDNVRLINDINNIANDFGVSLTDISINEASTPTGENVVDKTGKMYGEINLNFSVSSRYDTFKEFMYSLERSLRLVDIESFSVTVEEGVFYNFKVSLNTYWLR